jgi:hypothetical protein
MAILTGNDGALKVNGKNVLSLRNFSVEITRDTIETTTMGKDVRSYVGGLASFSGSADFYFDPDTATDGFDAAETTFNPTTGAVGDAIVTVIAYLKSDASNDIAFSGNCILTGYTVNSTMDGMVEGSLSFQGSGDGSDVGIAFSTTGNV